MSENSPPERRSGTPRPERRSGTPRPERRRGPRTASAFRDDGRGVSTTLGYVLALGITAILVTGLLVAAGGFVEDQRERVVRSELEVVGQQLASTVAAADRLAVAGEGDTSVAVETRLPRRVADRIYRVEIVTDGGDYAVSLSTDDPDITVTIGLVTRTTLETGDVVTGGPVRVVDTPSGTLELVEGGA